MNEENNLPEDDAQITAVPPAGIVPQEEADQLAIRIQDRGPLHKALVALDGMQGGEAKKGKSYRFDVKYDFFKNEEAEGAPSMMQAHVTMTKGVKRPEIEELKLIVGLSGAFSLSAEGRSAMIDTQPETANDAVNLVNDWLKGLRRTHDLRQLQSTWARRQDEADAQLYSTADKIRAAKPDTRLGKPV